MWWGRVVCGRGRGIVCDVCGGCVPMYVGRGVCWRMCVVGTVGGRVVMCGGVWWGMCGGVCGGCGIVCDICGDVWCVAGDVWWCVLRMYGDVCGGCGIVCDVCGGCGIVCDVCGDVVLCDACGRCGVC